MSAKVTGGTGIWSVTTDFATDKLFTNIVRTNVSVVQSGVPRLGWQPIVAQYMRVTAVLSTASAGDTLAISIAPSLLDAPQAARIITQPLLSTYENLLAKSTFFDYSAAFSMPGPATLTVRSNVYDITYDLIQVEATGALTFITRYQVDGYNQAQTYPVLLPDQPVKVRVSNVSAFASATYDLLLLLA